MNCLQKVLNFSEENPYLVFKDSRYIGIINCKTLTIKLDTEVKYKRGANYYSMC